MRTVFAMAFGVLTAASPIMALAETQVFDGLAAIPASSVNPPNPVEGCNRAKENTTKNAADAGFRGSVKWERLSNDSDCNLHTEGSRGTGYVYIFTARGTFSK